MSTLNQPLNASEMRRLVSAWIRIHIWPGFAVVLLAAASLQAGADTTQIGEYQLKAVFLFNFAKFVEWPPQASADARAPFTICVLGDDPFGSSLDDVVSGKTVGNRPISIRRVSTPEQSQKCRILFVSASERKRARGFLDALRGSSALTVGDTDDFIANGGIVEFKVKDSRVRIEINAEAAERANLRISSKLLSLAEPAGH